MTTKDLVAGASSGAARRHLLRRWFDRSSACLVEAIGAGLGAANWAGAEGFCDRQKRKNRLSPAFSPSNQMVKPRRS
nr:hypothetical protein [Pseudomonas sp. A46]